VDARYVNTLAACCKAIFEKMTQTKVISISLEEYDKQKIDYPVAKIVSYEDLDSKTKGNIILGFPDESMAILVASGIAENMGLPPIFTLDEEATDIINEETSAKVSCEIILR
jgi:CheY-specific phosphatase CheX